MANQIGDNIAYYRKNQGFTQEQLGEKVGVSGQAVSKWENGGVPDTILLPTIAQTLGVTIEALFGVEKKISDMEESEVCDILFRFCRRKYCMSPQINYFNFLFECLWSMQSGYFGNEELCSLDNLIEKNSGNPQITSQIIEDSGTTYLSLVKGFPFFCAVKDDDSISDKILNEEYFSEFFSLFADREALKAILYIQTLPSSNQRQYTAKTMAENIGISLEKFEQILPLLTEYGVLHANTLLLDDKTITTYEVWNDNPEIRPILMLAYQFIHARACYYDFTCNRTKPYFKS